MIPRKKIAVFISGRLTCYDVNLIPTLTYWEKYHDIHLFCSINGTREDLYHVKAEQDLAKWLRDICYKEYIFPDNYIENTHESTYKQIVNGKKGPYAVFSMLYNDMKAYQLIEEYCQKTGETFDVICKTRADTYFEIDCFSDEYRIPFHLVNNEHNILYSAIPPDLNYMWGDKRAPPLYCDAFAFGNKEVMKKYCDNYHFIINLNNERKGNLRVNFEQTLTEGIWRRALDQEAPNHELVMNLFNSCPIKVTYFNTPYKHNPDRRFRDTKQKELFWRRVEQQNDLIAKYGKLNSFCIVLVSNARYIGRVLETCHQLRTMGQWAGDICLIIGDDLVGSSLLKYLEPLHIQIKHFPDLLLGSHALALRKQYLVTDNSFQKLFQYHKLWLFDKYFCKWDRIIYLDAGVHIYGAIAPFFQLEGHFFAHSDAYPQYERRLHCQFHNQDLARLTKLYNLDIDYFQTTIMVFNTNIIKDDTFEKLVMLSNQYSLSMTNDQAIIALYFTCIEPIWKQIPLGQGYYDYARRNNTDKYIMTKCGPDVILR